MDDGLALPHRAPLWLLVALIVIISVGGPGSMVGFDFARTFNPSATLGTAQGMVNMGGFVASLLIMQAMGLILDAAASFRSTRSGSPGRCSTRSGFWPLSGS